MHGLRDSLFYYSLAEYVSGHDGLWHVVKRNGMTICSMGRAQLPDYDWDGPATCLECLVRLWRRTDPAMQAYKKKSRRFP